MNLGPFTEFLSNLSQITRWRYEIRDAGGNIFAASTRTPDPDISRHLVELSVSVARTARFQSASALANYELYGMPIKNGMKVLGALLAHGVRIDPGSGPQGSDGIGSRQAHQMEAFLESLVGLMQDRWAYEQESEEITEELTQKLEDIYLYSNLGTAIKTLRFSSAMLKDLAVQILGAMRTDMAFARLPERPEFDMLLDKKGVGDKISHTEKFVDSLIEAIPRQQASAAENYFWSLIPGQNRTTRDCILKHFVFWRSRCSITAHFMGGWD